MNKKFTSMTRAVITAINSNEPVSQSGLKANMKINKPSTSTSGC